MLPRFWIIVALALCASPAHADVAGAPAVIDGDTLRFDKVQIRLFGIVAPDLEQTCQGQAVAWPCGQAARDHLWELVAGEYLSCTERGYCTLADGRDLGELMVEAGFARADRRTAGTDYDAAEQSAKAAKRGLWAAALP